MFFIQNFNWKLVPKNQGKEKKNGHSQCRVSTLFARPLCDTFVGESDTNGQRGAHRDISDIPLGARRVSTQVYSRTPQSVYPIIVITLKNFINYYATNRLVKKSICRQGKREYY